MKPGALEFGAAAWGFAEATLFFIVPDVWLSAWAPRVPRRAMMACLVALAGALVGGAVMYLLGARDAAATLAVLERLPAISDAMVRDVDEAVRAHGAWAMFGGVVRGTPYKLFAVTAGAQDVGLATFLLVSVPARLLRFVIVTGAIALIARATRRRLSVRTQTLLVLAGWAVFYAFYFASMPN